MAEVTTLVVHVLAVFVLGLGVRIVAVRSEQVVYPVALVLIGGWRPPPTTPTSPAGYIPTVCGRPPPATTPIRGAPQFPYRR